MMKLSGLLLACLIVLFAAMPAYAASDDGIDAFLHASASSWNKSDFNGFMSGYENAPTTLYISSKTVIRGYAAIRARYAAHYGTSNLGLLSFSDVTKRMLGADYAVVIAHWHLAMPNGKHPTGIFSLVLHRSTSGWHIIDDHTP